MRNLFILFAMLCLSGSLLAKDLTVKGGLIAGTTMEIKGRTADTNDTMHKYTESFSTNTGLGLGIEYSLVNSEKSYGLDFLPADFELLGGLNYSLARSFAEYIGKNRLAAPDFSNTTERKIKYSYADRELTLQITSFYLKPRYFFALAGLADLYAGLKFSYNMVNIGGDNAEELALDNTLGYGFALGAIISDEWDIGLEYHTMGGLNDPTDGTEVYKLSETIFAAGYRFGAPRPRKEKAKPVEIVEEKIEPEEIIEEVEEVIEEEIPEYIPEETAEPVVIPPATPAQQNDILDALFENMQAEQAASSEPEKIIEEAPAVIEPVIEEEAIAEPLEPSAEETAVIEETEMPEEQEIEQVVETSVQTENISVPEVVEQPAPTEKTANETAEEVRQRMLQRMQERKI